MKNVVLFIYVFTFFGFSQELTLNEELNIYNYEVVKDLQITVAERLDIFEKKLKELNYNNIVKDETSIKSESFVTKMIFGSAMEVHYNVYIQFKEDRYKLLLNDFTVNDVRFGKVAIETMKKSSRKRWIGFINKELPQILANIENTSSW